VAAPAEKEFVAAIVGRPNVGKSTLFNRLVGRRMALVHDKAGTTRDRKEGQARLFDLSFRVIDTAGLEEAGPKAIESRMVGQTLKAVADADLILFMIDTRAGLTPLDRHFADRLRKFGKPLLLLANKCEGRAGQSGLAEAFALGMGEPIPLSAEHGEGMSDLYHAMTAFVAPPEREEEGAPAGESAPPPRALTLAIVGQPNAGKSTLMNRLLGEERVIVGPEPGLTRDSISIDWQWKERAIKLVDTAGLRRKAKVADPLEKLAAIDAMRAIQYADIVVLLIDAVTVQDFGHGIEKQDLQIAAHIEAEGRGLVIALNKWDLVEDQAKQRGLVRESLERSLAQIHDVPMVTMSALEGTNLDRLMQEVLAVDEKWNKRISTSRLNRWLEGALEANPPPMVKGRRIKIRYMTQARTRPPTFALFASQAERLPDTYVRYLANGLRKTFGFSGVPLRLHVRGGENPFDRDRKR
jgi:GTP-binding protein